MFTRAEKESRFLQNLPASLLFPTKQHAEVKKEKGSFPAALSARARAQGGGAFALRARISRVLLPLHTC